jgi:pyruvate dehydrogenase E2 component (dihydrolipoamide acetyltransferase)
MEFKFPDTGEGVTEGQFLKWLVEEGEEVEEDQAVAEVETDKAVVDVPAPANGKIKEFRAEPGDTVEVGEVIMVLDTGDEADTTEENTGDSEKEDDSDEDSGAETGSQTEDTEKEKQAVEKTSSSSEEVLALPKVRKIARDKGVDLASIKTGERITEEDVRAATGEQTRTETDTAEETATEPEEHEEDSGTSQQKQVDYSDVLATPSVRQLAREKNIDITAVEGSGRGGKVTREDVLAAAEGEQEDTEVDTSESEEVAAEAVVEGDVERVPLTNIRKTIAERMENSKYTAPHVTHVEKADVTELVELREDEKEKVDVHLTYLPFIMKAAVAALQKYPDLNAELNMESEEVVRYRSYDFNMAVDTERGLMVPLITDVDSKSIITLADEIVEKAEKAKDGDLSGDEMANGTFSVTNVGVIGGESFTPIINYPQTAILGIGKISETAEVVEGEVVPRMTVKLSLSYDHRVVDGATAARFMNEVVENLEDPNKLLMSL